MFCYDYVLRQNGLIWICQTTLLGWRSEWFYIADKKPALPKGTGHRPEKITEWDMPLSSRKM
jgi:hypothetical protein